MQKESVSKQGRKPTKSKLTMHKDLAFDDLDDVMDYIETEDAHDEGIVKDSKETRVSNADKVSTDKPNEGIAKPNKGTTKPNKGTAKPNDGNSDESVAPITIFRDDETIAQLLIDPKDKVIKVLEKKAESEAEEEKKKLVEKEATKAALIRDYNDIHARIKDDSILAARLQEEERKKFIIEERVKLLHDTIAAQRRFLAQQRAAEIKSRPPTRTQLRNQMMTYLKHVGGRQHSDLKNKIFEEIQVLYEKVKSSDKHFVVIGSAEDERIIRELNKKAAGIKKADSIKEESKEEIGTRKRKLGTRKKMKSRKRRFRHGTSEDEKENDELKLCLTIALDEDKEVDYEILDIKYPIKEWTTENLRIKPQFDETKGLEESNLNVVIRSNGQRRYFSTLMRVLSIFDREDLNAVYKLVMDIYQTEVPEGLVIHMLVEKKYPLKRKVLLQMLELKLESEEDSTMALELIRFVKKLITELEPEDSDGNEEDL
ncbi:hypothetical protein Tco_1454274 [Tanacetum coccineum]